MNTPNSSNRTDNSVVWSPSVDLINSCAMTRFMRHLAEKSYGNFTGFDDLHAWAVGSPEAFWKELLSFLDIVGEGQVDRVWGSAEGATPLAREWFPDFKINFSENILRASDDSVGIISWSEGALRREFSIREVKQASLSIARHLLDIGVKPGDRVFAYLPNIPESVICSLGAAAIGATWSSSGTDYEVDGLEARASRVLPTVLVATRSYQWRGVQIDARETIRHVVQRVSSIKHVVLIDYLGKGEDSGESVLGGVPCSNYHEVISGKNVAFSYPRFSFSHPLYIMFSSGTTGKPKGIVHGAGGTLLEHRKEHALHADVRPGDRLFYQTSTSWMMWNWLLSGLASQATLVMYDGDPMLEGGFILWRMAEQEQVTHFGTSAAFLGASEKQGVKPKERYALSALRAILSTGSTLYPSQFDYIMNAIKPLWIQSISGGTDIIGCFGLGCPLKPVRRGEVQAKSLGYDVCVYNGLQERVIGEEGELICANPAPSMPVYFLDDPRGESYRAAYFTEYRNVWRHGDFLEEVVGGGLLFLGRSDATLKPAGVRVSTADIYAALQQVSEVQQALAVGYLPHGATSEKIVLFVVLPDGVDLNDELSINIKETLRRSNVFFVPALILQAPGVPKTTNNKMSELSVKKILKGEDPGNRTALANPEVLNFFSTEGVAQVKAVLG